MREFIAKYGVVVIAAALILAGSFVYFFGWSSSTVGGNSSLSFFVDEETGEESVRSASEIPPLLGRGGKPTVVKAFKYTCGSEKEAKVMYYLKYTEEARSKLLGMAEGDPNRADLVMRGEMVRSPATGSKWVWSGKSEALEIKSVPECSPAKRGTIVLPR